MCASIFLLYINTNSTILPTSFSKIKWNHTEHSCQPILFVWTPTETIAIIHSALTSWLGLAIPRDELLSHLTDCELSLPSH